MFKMPEVCIGMTVLWYTGSDGDKGTAAIVTGVGTSSISLSICPKGYTNHMTRDGVKHISDPDKKAFDKESVGFWGYTDWWKAIVNAGVKLYPAPTTEQPTSAPTQPTAPAPAKK